MIDSINSVPDTRYVGLGVSSHDAVITVAYVNPPPIRAPKLRPMTSTEAHYFTVQLYLRS